MLKLPMNSRPAIAKILIDFSIEFPFAKSPFRLINWVLYKVVFLDSVYFRHL